MFRITSWLVLATIACGYPQPARVGDGGSDATAVTCNGIVCQPPSPVCVGNTLRAFAASCVDGACAYQPLDTPCPAGCTNGACVVSCGSQVCDQIPPAACISATELCTYGATCSGGTCSYPPTCMTCPGTCASGACACSDTIEDAAPYGGGISYPGSLAVDAAGGVHITYYEPTSATLGYAYEPAGGAWTVATIDSSGDVGRSSSLAVDGSGGLHVVYDDTSNGNLVYAYRPAMGAWTKKTFAGGTSGSLVVDAAGTVHVVYGDLAQTHLYYASKAAGGSWTTATVASDATLRGPVLAIDAHGNLHVIAWGAHTVSDGQLRYATKPAGGAWTIQPTGIYAVDPSLAVDSSGGLHVSCVVPGGSGPSVLDHAYLPPGATSWTTSTIDSNHASLRSALAVDASGGVHVAYQLESSWQLQYAYEAPGSSAWTIVIADGSMDTGYDPAVVVDAKGTVHISYSDAKQIRYARICR